MMCRVIICWNFLLVECCGMMCRVIIRWKLLLKKWCRNDVKDYYLLKTLEKWLCPIFFRLSKIVNVFFFFWTDEVYYERRGEMKEIYLKQNTAQQFKTGAWLQSNLGHNSSSIHLFVPTNQSAATEAHIMELQNTVKEALNALYHHPDDAVRMQADRWLQDFQRTIDAWQVIIAEIAFFF